MPADLTGRSVLDIGCNAGFYSFEMKRRGAARVLGVDSNPRYLDQARFAARVLRFRDGRLVLDTRQEPADAAAMLAALPPMEEAA